MSQMKSVKDEEDKTQLKKSQKNSENLKTSVDQSLWPISHEHGICYQSERHNPIEKERQASSTPYGPLIVFVGICYQNESYNPIEMEICPVPGKDFG